MEDRLKKIIREVSDLCNDPHINLGARDELAIILDELRKVYIYSTKV
jgi:hypothetical protein